MVGTNRQQRIEPGRSIQERLQAGQHVGFFPSSVTGEIYLCRLDGFYRATPNQTEVGVPVLSKIPFINRFFTNRISSKEERTLLILIRPEIIIQQENEDILFPGLSDSIGGAAAYLR